MDNSQYKAIMMLSSINLPFSDLQLQLFVFPDLRDDLNADIY